MFGNINAALLRQALGPVAACTGACVPFNVFGGEGSITEAMLDFVTFDQRDESEQRIWDLSANATGHLFELPGGPLGLAFGANTATSEDRLTPIRSSKPVKAQTFLHCRPAAVTTSTRSCGVECPAVCRQALPEPARADRCRALDELFDIGFDDDVQGRRQWKPIPDLRLRATWAEGFRAPTIGELFGTPSRFDQTIVDPCSDLNNSGASAEVRANCISNGVPADGSYVQINPQLSVITGGNEDLQPETSKSWVVGAVFSPSAIPRFSVEANYLTSRSRVRSRPLRPIPCSADAPPSATR